MLNKHGKFGAKMFAQYTDIMIFVLGYFNFNHPVVQCCSLCRRLDTYSLHISHNTAIYGRPNLLKNLHFFLSQQKFFRS